MPLELAKFAILGIKFNLIFAPDYEFDQKIEKMLSFWCPQ